MLVLSRKRGEAIIIPEYGLVITIVRVHGQSVRVGIDAAADIGIYRSEVWDRLKQAPPIDGVGGRLGAFAVVS